MREHRANGGKETQIKYGVEAFKPSFWHIVEARWPWASVKNPKRLGENARGDGEEEQQPILAKGDRTQYLRELAEFICRGQYIIRHCID